MLVGGDHLSERAFGEQAVRDLAVGESVAFALLLIALVVIFGGVVAASVPLVGRHYRRSVPPCSPCSR